MRNRPAALLIAALALSALPAHELSAQAQRPENRGDKEKATQDKASLWMKHKLAASQTILEGMTRGDYGMIEKSARGMQVVGYLEEWVRGDVPGYKAQIHAFEHANAAIVLAARDKNLDGVTIAYTQLTISCVQCHKIVRDVVRE